LDESQLLIAMHHQNVFILMRIWVHMRPLHVSEFMMMILELMIHKQTWFEGSNIAETGSP